MLSEHAATPEKRPRRSAATPTPPLPTGLGAGRYLQLFEKLNPLSGLLDTRLIATRACELISGLLDVAACSVLLGDPAGETLQLCAATHIPAAEWDKIQSPVEGSVCGRVFASGKGMLINGRAAFKRAFGREPFERYLTPSTGIVPLTMLGKIAGVINVAHPLGRRAFRKRDIALLEAAANIIGAALATARQFQENEIQQHNLLGIFDSLHVGLLTVNSRGIITQLNARMRKMLGLTEAPPSKLPLSELLPATLYTICTRLMHAENPNPDEPAHEMVHETLSGKQRLLGVTAVPMSTLGGVADTFLLIFEDISREEEVKRLRESESMKRSFLSIISHELRTPLAVMRPALELISPGDAAVTPQTLAQVHKMLLKNTNRLNDVVSAILDVTEIENGTLRLALRPADIHEILNEIVDNEEQRCTQKKIAVVRQFDSAAPPIAADRRRLKQVFSELFDNAIKFSNPGNEIRLQTTLNDPWIEIELSNNGPMIALERRTGLFEKFYQCDQTMTRASGGCGLGLFLARNILKLHGGSIELKESTSDWTTFVLRLPLGISVVPAETPQPSVVAPQ